MNSIATSFTPAWWLPEGHTQTLWRKFAGSKTVNHRRQRIELADGDFIDLDWSADTSQADSDHIVLIVHGLCGCSESSYVLELQTHLNNMQIANVAMNLRGCSGEVNRKARTYHSGVSDDLLEVVNSLYSEFPDKQIVTVGYSLGANVLLKYLGEAGSASPLLKAIAVSTPFTLSLCSQSLLSGLSKIYGQYFTRRLHLAFSEKMERFSESGNDEELNKLRSLGDIKAINSVWEFDEKVTAPLHGFNSADDYYKQCSSIGFLNSIATNTLLIQSSDDPMIPPHSLPQPQDLSATTQLELLGKGGHVGFVNAGKDRWLEKRITDFILAD